MEFNCTLFVGLKVAEMVSEMPCYYGHLCDQLVVGGLLD